MDVPSMWRVELLHPLLVHFPIALLIVGAGLRFAGALRHRFPVVAPVLPGARIILLLGTLGAWAAVYTGTLADAAVARTLCDPTVVEAHERWAYWVAGLFTTAVAVDGLLWWSDPDRWIRRALIALLAGCLLAGSATLLYVGHLGAQLVYQQGAAVYDPGPDCAAFE
jgi:uncharacterized membrane protein